MMAHEIAEIKERLELLKEKYYENKGSYIDYYFDRIEADLQRLEQYIQRRIKK
jgi:NAD-dependent DNA ligase